MTFSPYFTRAAGVSALLFALCLQPAAGRTFEVGPGRELTAVGSVPWDALEAGDTVRIHWRPQPYREKWNVSAQGTNTSPVCVEGVPSPDGKLPVIEGREAVTPPGLDFPGGERSIIRVGATGRRPVTPSYITIKNLEVRGGRPPYRFTGLEGGAVYLNNTAGIYIAAGNQITIRGCIIRDCANGLMSSGAETLVEECHIFDNGNEGSIYEHNVYTSASGMMFQYNHLGPLRSSCPGNNLKDRSSGLVVRYNWIEGGNRQLDLVDANEHHAPLSREPRYRETFVYGNVFVEHEGGGNNQIVHYGGDSGEEEFYRKGTLHFYHNTVISCRNDPTTLFRLAGGGGVIDCRNNIVWLNNGRGRLVLGAGLGHIVLAGNWIPDRCDPPSEGATKLVVTGFAKTRRGGDPGFLDPRRADFRLPPTNAPAAGVALPLSKPLDPGNAVTLQYQVHRRKADRPPETLTLPGALVQSED
jgi:hypothetical protein